LLVQTPSPKTRTVYRRGNLSLGAEKNRCGLPRAFIKKKYLKRRLFCRLHTKAPVAYCVAQTPGEKGDVSAKMRDALQQFVPQCVFSATFLSLGAIGTGLLVPLKTSRARLAIFFL
jgi:hypothetical protein